MADLARLPLRVWAARKPRAVIVAVHGFNDYSNAFAMPGPWLAKRGVTVYAYDQRGFGKAPHRGFWAGEEAMVQDLRTVARLVKQRHPRLPLYVMGESMGGAVAMIAFAGAGVPDAEGAILSAPAVWGWRAMNPLYKSALWIAAHTVPSFSPTGEGLGVQASDNIEMLRALGRDPLVIKETRVDTIYGLVGLMDKAYESGPLIRKPVLYLYGKKDELVPRNRPWTWRAPFPARSASPTTTTAGTCSCVTGSASGSGATSRAGSRAGAVRCRRARKWWTSPP